MGEITEISRKYSSVTGKIASETQHSDTRF